MTRLKQIAWWVTPGLPLVVWLALCGFWYQHLRQLGAQIDELSEHIHHHIQREGSH